MDCQISTESITHLWGEERERERGGGGGGGGGISITSLMELANFISARFPNYLHKSWTNQRSKLLEEFGRTSPSKSIERVARHVERFESCGLDVFFPLLQFPTRADEIEAPVWLFDGIR